MLYNPKMHSCMLLLIRGKKLLFLCAFSISTSIEVMSSYFSNHLFRPDSHIRSHSPEQTERKSNCINDIDDAMIPSSRGKRDSIFAIQQFENVCRNAISVIWFDQTKIWLRKVKLRNFILLRNIYIHSELLCVVKQTNACFSHRIVNFYNKVSQQKKKKQLEYTLWLHIVFEIVRFKLLNYDVKFNAVENVGHYLNFNFLFLAKINS